MATARYVFACPRGHKVAVDPNRYWARARCPTCGNPVDGSRRARALAWMRGAAPRSRLRIGKVSLAPLDGLGWLVLLFVGVVALVYRLAGDTTWWGTALIYAGKWPWLVVPLLCIPFAIRRRSALIPLGLALLLILGPLMGGRLSMRPLLAGKERILRVLTYNAMGGFDVARTLPLVLEAYKPDIAAFQECGPPLRVEIARQQGWEVLDTSRAGLCFMSRYPLMSQPVQMPAKVFREAGGSAAAVRYPIATPGGAVTVFNLHLETPRHGVEFLLHDPAQAPKKIRANTLLRDTESRVVRRWVDSTTGARLVVGDFNLPVESAIFRHHWGDLEDAWDAAGNGFGYSKRNGWIRVRIDHTLSTGPLKAVRVKVGKDYGSDHLPVVTEYEY